MSRELWRAMQADSDRLERSRVAIKAQIGRRPPYQTWELEHSERIFAAKRAGWTIIAPDPTGKLVGLPPTAKSPCDFEEIPA